MPMKRRQRLTPGESRGRAIEAAHALLLEHGPKGVTLKAVAARIGQTHANLLHHFGSAAGLQSAVVENMARHLVAKIGEAVPHRQHGQLELDGLVDIVFDTFGRDGAGRLAIWMILTGDGKALDPVFHAIRDFIGKLTMESPADKVREVSVALTLMAIGDALLGAPLAEALGVHRRVARELALLQLVALPGLRYPEPVQVEA